MSEPHVLLAACLTPPGSAAIAVVAVRGPGAWEVGGGLFLPRTGSLPLLEEVRPGQLWLGRMVQGPADEVVLAVKRTAPTPWLEVHCHGGREVVAWLLELLQQRGVTICSWPELERRTTDQPLQALAAAALACAPTVRTASILLDQFHGAFAQQVRQALAALQAGDMDQARAVLDDLARFDAIGRHLTEPWRVTVAGAVNAGKSSLVNALAGYQRSVVTPLPGTTRDVVTIRIAVDGWPVELADTAGLRSEAESLEEQGMHLARTATATADLVLWVLDAAAEPLWPEPGTDRVLLVVNKIDLSPVWDLDRAVAAVRVSALTGEGLPALCQAVAGRLVAEPPPRGAGVGFTPSLCERLAEARRLLSANLLRETLAMLEGMLSDPPTP